MLRLTSMYLNCFASLLPRRAQSCGLGVAFSVLVALLGVSAPPVSAATNGAGPQAGGTPQHYDFMILALSWSPTFCASSAKRGDSAQCQNPANRGFVVHGLWPQANDGARLRCGDGKAEFSKALFERALDVFPDLNLAQAQWQRHGQCFGLSPDVYLDRTETARSKLVIPERLRAITQPASLGPEDIRRDFVRANSGLTVDAISVSCRKSTLVEVLICMKSDLSGFEPCPQVAKRSCRAATIGIPASLQR